MKVTRSFAAVNQAFHRTYDAARASRELEAPVFVVLDDALAVCRRGRVRRLHFAPVDFDVIKSAAHAPVAVYCVLRDAVGRPLGAATRRALSGLMRAARASVDSLADCDDDVARDVRDALERSVSFIDRALSRDRLPRAALDAFAGESARVVRRLTRHATRAQLVSLHAVVDRAMATLSAKERRALQVVVAGDHQARARSLAMQYFQKRFGETPGAEVRVTYGEGVTSVKEGLELVGTRRLDRAVAKAFFGDPRRLQQDVLGDAAAEILAEPALLRRKKSSARR